MNVFLLLELAADRDSDRVACGSRSGGDSYATLSGDARRIASAITEVRAGAVVFVGLHGPSVPRLVFGAAAAGVPFAPLNYRLPAALLAELVRRFDRPLVLADEQLVSQLASHLPDVRSAAGWLNGAQLAEPADVVADPVEPAVVLFTSGTTAAPKAVHLGHDNLTSYALSTVDFGSVGPDEATLVSVPPYHIAGIGATVTNVYSGRRICYLPNFDAREWLELVERESVSHAMVVPTMLARILQATGGVRPAVPSLRSIAYGGAKMRLPVLLRALELFPDVGFTNAYGLTETSATIAVLGPDEHRAAAGARSAGERSRLTSIGRVVPGVEAQIRDASDQVLWPGAVGQLWVRGAQVSGRYHDGGSALDEDGWFPTRDRAWMDQDGYLFLAGRVDDVIIRGGENVHPAEIEDVLIQHPRVADVSVVGIPDDEWGERIAAAVIPDGAGACDVDEIRRYVRDRLRGSRTPDDVVVRRDLPYGPTGKLARQELAAQLQAELAASGDVAGGRSDDSAEVIR